MKPVFTTLLLVLLVLCSSFLQSTMAADPPMASPTASPSICGSKCAERCSEAKEIDRCLKYCGICCKECKCVPSGTYGNKSECPCYMNLKNSKGTSKCP